MGNFGGAFDGLDGYGSVRPRSTGSSGGFGGAFDGLDIGPGEPTQDESPGLVSRALHGVGSIIGAPKAGIDWLARQGARAQGLDVSDTATTGEMLRNAVGLNQGDEGYAGKLGGRAVQFAGDLATDPLTYTGLGLAGKAGKVASAALGAGMGLSALDEGERAYERYKREGFTPEVAEEALGTALSAGMAGLAGTHALRGEHVAPGATGRATEPIQANPDVWPGPVPPEYQPRVADNVLNFAEPKPIDLTPPETNFRPEDLAEVQYLQSAKLLTAEPNPAELQRRAAYYEGRGMPAAAEATRAEIARRSEPIPAEPIPVEPIPEVQPILEIPEPPPGGASTPAVSDATLPPSSGLRLGVEAPVVPEGIATNPVQDIGQSTARGQDQTLPLADPLADPVADLSAGRGPERRQEAAPVAEDRRVTARRQAIAQELGMPEDHPAVSRIAQAEHDLRVDPLTGLGNKRAWEELQGTKAPSDHNLMVDLKEFKAVNDTYGHDAGDKVLKAAGEVIAEHVGDDAARFGGDEFGGILRGASLEEAQAKAATIQQALAEKGVTYWYPDGTKVDIPGIKAHIGVGKDAHAADQNANANAAESRKTGRGVLPPEAGAEPGVAPSPSSGGEALPTVERTPVQSQADALAALGWTPEQLGLRNPTDAELQSIIETGERPSYPPDGHRALPTNLGGKAAENAPSPTAAERQATLAEKQKALIEASGEANNPLFSGKEVIPGADAARQRISKRAEKLGKGTASFGVDPAHLKDMAHVGADYIARGAKDFAQWSSRMVQEFGESVKEHLSDLWDQAQRVAKDFGYTFLGTGEGRSEFTPAETGAVTIPAKPRVIKPIPPKPVEVPSEAPSSSAKPIPEAGTNVPKFETGKPEAMSGEPPKNATVADMLIEGWKAGLVSAPGTQLANPGSNLGEAGFRGIESGVAGLVDRALGGERTRYSGEAIEQMKGGLKNIPEAFRVFREKLGGVLKSEGAIPGKAGQIIRAPLAMLEVGDAPTAKMNEGAVLQGLAYRQARSELPGGSRSAIEARQREIIQNPSDAMKAAVEKEVLSRQFRAQKDPENPDTLIEGLKSLRSKHKWLNIVAPFIETPGQIAKLAIQRTPFGFKKAFTEYRAYKNAIGKVSPAELAELKGNAVDAITRPLVGTTVMGLFGAYAKAGGMTGSGPTDPKQVALKKQTGWQPYSFVVPDGKGGHAYIPFNRFEPASSLLGFAADMAEMKDQKKAGDLLDKGLGSIMQNLTSKTYLQGLADAAEFINDPKRMGSQYVSGLAASVVPNIVAKAAQAYDPIQRDTSSSQTGLMGIPERILKSVEARIPGLSTTLPARRTATGKEQERPGNALTRFALPVQVTADKPGTEVEKFLVDIDSTPGQPSKDFTIPNSKGKKLRLNDSEWSVLADANAKTAEELRKNYLGNPRFMRLDPDEQKRAVNRLLQSERDKAKERLLRNPAFRRRLRQASV